MRSLSSIALIGLTLAGCAGSRRVEYQTGTLPTEWQRVRRDRGAHEIYHHAKGGSILSSSSCHVSDSDASLDVLTNHLLLEFQEVREKSRTPFVLAGRAALRTTIEAKLDGVPIGLDLIVLKKDGCSVDLQLVASPRTLTARQPDFNRFVREFELQTASKDKM